MATTQHLERHDVLTLLSYYDDPGDGSPPAPLIIGKENITNVRKHRDLPFVVTDVSGSEDQYTLDSHGFQYHRQPCTEKDFFDDKKIAAEYYPECERLLKDLTGARRIHIFNHKVRRGPTQWHHLGLKNTFNRGPVTKTHCDQSYVGAEKRLRWELPEEADELLKKRYQIINIWRPIKTIRKDPVAVADSFSVPDEDLISASILENGHDGRQWIVRPNLEHRWYFKHLLGPEEVLLIKCFDSNTKVARR